MIGIHDFCHSRCYNSYIDSEHLCPHAHFPCPDQCVPWLDMCRGVAWCREELQHCSEALRCQTYKFISPAGFAYTVTLTRHNLTSYSLAPAHHYCLADSDVNNGMYDSIDRSDETLSSNTTQQLVYAALLIPCNHSYMCNGVCWPPYYWCAVNPVSCTTPPPSTLQTPPCVETPHSGEDCLVTIMTMRMDHCTGPAGDVTAPCKHVPGFGILIGTENSPLNISPGPVAKTVRTRFLD